MVRIQIDGGFYEVKADRNLLETCLSLGFDIPYFCNHPALGSVGACRQCAVKKYNNADDKIGKIIMSCMEPVTEGLIISTGDPEVKAFRAAVIESLMTNHPHDCPVCDEGGECQLQDMTVMTGHNYRRFVFKKRTYENQDLGPFIQHEMNRCIQCYRCVRFYRNYAGGKDLNVFGSARQVYFGRSQEGVLASEFSGNLAEVCPTGVFTDKTHKKHFSRKWDLTNAPSICIHCSLGCNIIVSERYGYVRRVMSRYNASVNGYFICDRGRFGYEFINNPERIRKIMIRPAEKSDLREAQGPIDTRLSEALNKKSVIGIGSPRASLESNFALSVLVGKDNFYHGVSGDEHKLVKKTVELLESGIASTPSLKEVEKCDAVLILGEDVTNTAPMLALSLRQSARNKTTGIAKKLGIPEWNEAAVRELDQGVKSPVYVASSFSTKLDDLAEEKYYLAPEEIARLGFAVASALDPGAPVPPHQDRILKKTARKIADGLSAADHPLIVTGTSMKNENILNSAANIAIALSASGKKSSFFIALPESNSAGLAMLGGNTLDEASEVIDRNNADTLIILENDLYRRIGKEKADSFFEKCSSIIVLDHMSNQTTEKADILLPVTTFAESEGTIVNNEGRAQRYYSVLPSKEPVKDSWRWISELIKISGRSGGTGWEKFDDVVSGLATSDQIFAPLKEQMPDADFRFFNTKIALQTERFSGRTAINANVSVSEPKPPGDADSPLDFSMEGYQGIPPGSLTPFYWSPGWNSYQATNKYLDEPAGHLKEGGDQGIRLFIFKKDHSAGYFKSLPEPFRKKPGELLIVPVYRLFGSEELSSRGDTVAGVIGEPFILLNENEIERLHLVEHNQCSIIINQVVIKAGVEKNDTLTDGVAGLSLFKSGILFPDIPAWGKILS